MKVNWALVLIGVTALLASGCRTYNYQLTQPAAAAQVIADREVTISCDSIEYRFVRETDHLAVRILNRTEGPVVLRGDRSYVVDPRGESHPLPGRVIGPHSFTAMRLPPEPASGQIIGGFGPAWVPGVYGYGPYPYCGFYGGFYGPPVASYRVITPYDWRWHTGPARLCLAYERNGKPFEQVFEFVRKAK